MAVGRWPSAARAVLRAKAEAGTRIQELPEEHEVLRRWDLPEAAKAKREVPSAAERQKTLAGQGGKCALCGAGTCELDHVVPVRQPLRACKLCRRCAPTSLESRVAPGVMEYARSPKLPPLVFEAQACRGGCNALANAPFPLPILCPANGLSPWTACSQTWALWRVAATRGTPA